MRYSLNERIVRYPTPRLANGPSGVLASLRRGLSAVDGLSFTVNRGKPGGVALVLSDLAALRQAVEWKRSGRIERLLAGPNLVVHPSDAADLMSSPEIDVHLVPSDWVKARYVEILPELEGRIAIWPAGVDAQWWAPSPARRDGRRVVVYVKDPGNTAPPILHEQVNATRELLETHGWELRTVVYGAYDRTRYRDELSQCSFAVVFSSSESQGLSLAESWSMDVPTLVWEYGRYRHDGATWTSSSAPYLSPMTGAQFANVPELLPLLSPDAEWRRAVRPREWVLENMTDEVSVGNLMQLAFPGGR